MRIIFVVMVFVLAACSSGVRSGGGSAGSSATPATPPATGPADVPPPVTRPTPGGRESLPPETGAGAHTVTFAIRGSVRRASVTYTTPSGRTHRSVVSPPWRKAFTVADGQSIDVNAHSSGSGELTCTLRVDGELVKSATSSGGSATVDCGDSLGF
jgi:hypothetical protein